MTLCHLPSVRLNTLPLVVNLFLGIFLPPFLTTNTTLEGAAMSRPMLGTRRRKIDPPFGGFAPVWGGEFSKSLFFVYAAQFLRRGVLLNAEEKKRIFRGGAGLSPALCARLDSQALCLPCRKQENSPTPIVTPYRMASLWENLAPTTHSLTPRPFYRPTLFRPVGTSEKARSDRLCRAL